MNPSRAIWQTASELSAVIGNVAAKKKTCLKSSRQKATFLSTIQLYWTIQKSYYVLLKTSQETQMGLLFPFHLYN